VSHLNDRPPKQADVKITGIYRMKMTRISRHLLPALTFACAMGFAPLASAQTMAAPAGAMSPNAPGGTMSPNAPGGAMSPNAPGGAMSPMSSMAPAAPVAPAAKAMAGKLASFKTLGAATAHCPGDAVVWSTLSKSKSFHLAGSKYYGKTKHGAFVCKSEALAAGFHAAKN
jgi:hypothetical protein